LHITNDIVEKNVLYIPYSFNLFRPLTNLERYIYKSWETKRKRLNK